MVLIEEATELPEMPDAIPVEVLRSGQPFSYWVRFALRQKPDLIVVGEVRGPEALAMLQAASTGHPGICTIHAPDPQTALRNLERFAGQTGEMQPAMVRGLICSPSVQLVVAHIDRIDGKRRVGRIEEVTATGGAGGAGDRFTTNVLFTWERSGWKKGYPVEGAWGRNQW
jgi:Flp pilus assembly CpaF family ATPase